MNNSEYAPHFKLETEMQIAPRNCHGALQLSELWQGMPSRRIQIPADELTCLGTARHVMGMVGDMHHMSHTQHK